MKPIILTFTAFYLPGYQGGGPIRTIANMVERLGDEFEFWIVTKDRDLGDEKSYPNVQIDAWNSVGKAKVFYASAAMLSLSGFLKIMRETPHDLLYLNSFFDPRFTVGPVFMRWLGLVVRRPLVMAPRGEFSSGALRIKSWKKKPFILLARMTGLFSGVTWHASTEAEAGDIQRNFIVNSERLKVAQNIAVAGDLLQKNGSDFLIFEDNGICSSNGSLRICFLSRIAAMKNLDFALEVLSRVKVFVDFKIYGPKEDKGYWDKCSSLIESLPKNINVSYCGSVDHADVKKVISASDLFFVPSRGENFGHVFMESLSVGVPILVSDQTPWRDLALQGFGWDISLDRPDDFVEAIESFSKVTVEGRNIIRRKCIDFARKKSEDPLIVELNRQIFSRLLM
jgi:glycosyltransferase involved in cell wall biosynthesis